MRCRNAANQTERSRCGYDVHGRTKIVAYLDLILARLGPVISRQVMGHLYRPLYVAMYPFL
jgi:hypothetical protein